MASVCRKTSCLSKNGCRLLLALLVLHRAKLLASNQSILALGRSPRTGRQPFVPLHLCIDSHLCRCIVQRLCAAVIMRPCIVALCGWLQASLLGLRAVAPVKSPFPGERGQGDRDSELEVCFKNKLFLQSEATASAVAFPAHQLKTTSFFQPHNHLQPFRYGLFVKNVL